MGTRVCPTWAWAMPAHSKSPETTKIDNLVKIFSQPDYGGYSRDTHCTRRVFFLGIAAAGSGYLAAAVNTDRVHCL